MTMLMERFAPLFELQRDFNRFLAPGGAAYLPAADVLAGEEAVLVHMDVPGLSADNLEIELENDVLPSAVSGRSHTAMRETAPAADMPGS